MRDKGKQPAAYLPAGIKLNFIFIVHNCIYLATCVAQKVHVGTKVQVLYT